MAYEEREVRHSTTWTTTEVVRYCRANLNDAKALSKLGLGLKDAQTYLKLYPDLGK